MEQDGSAKERLKMNRYLLFLVILILQTWIVHADNAERDMFIEKGFNWKHYEIAKKNNLDLENYTIFVSNKSNKIKGAVMMGIGGGLCIEGLLLFVLAAILEPYDELFDDYNDDYNVVDNTKTIYTIAGGVSVATGAGLLIGGAVKRSKIGKVFTKSGTRLSLRPELDAIKDRYGMQLSLSF